MFDNTPWIFLSFVALFLLTKIVQLIYRKKSEKEHNESTERHTKKVLKRLIEDRAERTDFSEFDEDKFWELMEKIHRRSKTSFKNSMGVFKDLIKKYSPEELVQLDNLLIRLFKENVNQDIYAASRIIFKTNDLGATLLLMNLLMMHGEVYYKQACLDPNLIIGKEFLDIESRVFQDVIAEVYLIKADSFIPEIIDKDDQPLEIPGQHYTDKQLPTQYEELWFNYY